MPKNKLEETVWIYSLQNAVFYDGKANSKSVIGKVISVLKKQGYTPKEIIPVVTNMVEKVNKLSLEQQISELKKLSPELLVKEKKTRDFSLPDLPDAVKGKVVTRFPPEPNGFLHIGHAKAAIIDYEYAKIYDGSFILRFDDTNPENIDKKFYDEQKKDLTWLGIEWDKEYRTSDNLQQHYKFAEQLIKQGDAYICTCPPEEIKECRFHGHECSCRGQDACIDDISVWKDMISSSEVGILRLKGDMSCDNTAMRDPTLFRVIEKNHPIHGDKYRVWPTYDFAGAVEDSISGVTHPFRTKEYELRDECYFHLLDLLGLPKPHLMEFARLSIEGMPVSKRKIKPLIDKGLVSGFDDIRLPTLRGLNKRGIKPDAIKQFVFSQGISKVESTVTFGLLESYNRKILDPLVKRFFFVPDPVKLNVKKAPSKEKNISFHPSNKKLGSRTIKTKNIFYIPRTDVERLNKEIVFRLKDLFNVKTIGIDKKMVTGEYIGEKLISDSIKMQWTTDDYIPLKILIPDVIFKNKEFNKNSLRKINGYAEKAVENIKDGEIVQFERFGFVKIENKNGEINCFFTHK